MGAWVKINATFKDLVQSKLPFEDIEVKGNYSWQDGGELIRLDESYWSDSGAFHCKPKSGYMLIMRIATENTDFFQDQIKDTYEYKGGDNESDPPSDVDWVKEVYTYEDTAFFSENQSNVIFTLYGDTDPRDYVSLDVDGDISGIANFKIRKNGDQIAVSAETSDDTFVRLMGAYVWDANATATSDETTEETGEGSDDVTIPLPVDDNQESDKNGDLEDTGEDKPPITTPPKPPSPTPTPEPEPEPSPSPSPEPEDDDDDEMSSTSIVLLIIAIGALIGTAIIVARMGSGE